MLDYLLITTGPIAAALFIVAVVRIRRKSRSEMEIVVEYHFPEDEEELVDEVEQSGRHWRRSYAG